MTENEKANELRDPAERYKTPVTVEEQEVPVEKTTTVTEKTVTEPVLAVESDESE